MWSSRYGILFWEWKGRRNFKLEEREFEEDFVVGWGYGEIIIKVKRGFL